MRDNNSGTEERIDVDYEHGSGKLLVFLELDEAEQQAIWEWFEGDCQLPDDVDDRILEALGVEGGMIANQR